LQEYWEEIERQVPVEEPSAIDHLFKLVAIGLADSGLDECGFSSFEFQAGWDRDHGLGVLMHRDRVLAAGGDDRLIGGPGVVEAPRVVQSYDLDDGDFSLPGPVAGQRDPGLGNRRRAGRDRERRGHSLAPGTSSSG
jgi:hypothetical protein